MNKSTVRAHLRDLSEDVTRARLIAADRAAFWPWLLLLMLLALGCLAMAAVSVPKLLFLLGPAIVLAWVLFYRQTETIAAAEQHHDREVKMTLEAMAVAGVQLVQPWDCDASGKVVAFLFWLTNPSSLDESFFRVNDDEWLTLVAANAREWLPTREIKKRYEGCVGPNSFKGGNWHVRLKVTLDVRKDSPTTEYVKKVLAYCHEQHTFDLGSAIEKSTEQLVTDTQEADFWQREHQDWLLELLKAHFHSLIEAGLVGWFTINVTLQDPQAREIILRFVSDELPAPTPVVADPVSAS